MKTIESTDTFKIWREKINADIFNNAVLKSFDYDLLNTSGVSLAVIGGNYYDGDDVTSIADTTLTMTADSDNFVVLNGNTGALEVYTTEVSIPTGAKKVVKLYNVILDEFETITSIVDYRSWISV